MPQQRQRRGRHESVAPPPLAAYAALLPARALILPLTFTLILLTFALLPAVRSNPRLLWSFLSAGAALLGWSAALLVAARRTGRKLMLNVAVREQHYFQACAHTAV